ncbi:unnamed protein product [Haemonchus placei]|uniref:Malectin_like domain-containing protein n=1 Tax=Haemonchus placei TaxID=6290 RepID=A0A0N4VXW8_HAEPC|nr:unnamed protein product [Haemonchus placei]
MIAPWTLSQKAVILTVTRTTLQSMFFRGAEDLPVHSFLQGSKPPNCTGIKDEYCRLPYYTAIHDLFPPEHSLWVPVPSPATVPYPIKLSLIDRVRVGGNRLNLTFELRGGFDKMSLHVTPLNGYELVSWSFTNIDLKEFGRRTTYFVFLTYGFEMPEYRRFWILLENVGAPSCVPSTMPLVHGTQVGAPCPIFWWTSFSYSIIDRLLSINTSGIAPLQGRSLGKAGKLEEIGGYLSDRWLPKRSMEFIP